MTNETLDEPTRPQWQRFRWWLSLAAFLAVVWAIFASWQWVNGYPDRQQAEQDMASGVGQAEHTTVTAVCTVPNKNGYDCQLRDAAGRYGYSITTFASGGASGPQTRFSPAWHAETTWNFPVNADGTGAQTLNLSPPRTLSLGITGAGLMISGALGDPDVLDLYGAIDCGDKPDPTVVITCTVHAPIQSATLRPLGNDEYQLAYRVTLPNQQPHLEPPAAASTTATSSFEPQ